MSTGRKTGYGLMALIFTIVNFRMIMAVTPVPQKAIVEQPVELVYPCNINDSNVVMLTNSDSGSEYVSLYRDNRPDLTRQNPAYKGKVELDDRRMTNGTLVFMLHNMSRSFEGKYYCYVFRNGERILIGTRDLKAEDSGGGNMKKNLNHIIWTVIAVIIFYYFCFIYFGYNI